MNRVEIELYNHTHQNFINYTTIIFLTIYKNYKVETITSFDIVFIIRFSPESGIGVQT